MNGLKSHLGWIISVLIAFGSLASWCGSLAREVNHHTEQFRILEVRSEREMAEWRVWREGVTGKLSMILTLLNQKDSGR